MSYSFQNKNSNAAVTVGELNQVVNGLERPYKIYSVILNQASSGATPTVYAEIQNDFVDIDFTFSNLGGGLFLCTASENVFTTNKCIGFAYSGNDAEDNYSGALVQFSTYDNGLPENEFRIFFTSGSDYNILIRLEIKVSK